MTEEEGLSRSELLRRTTRGAGAFLLGGALAPSFLAAPGSSAAATVDPKVQRFVSRPDLLPMTVDVVRSAQGTGAGYLFVSPSSGPGQRGPVILDDAGEVVWCRATDPQTAMNFRAALYRGRPVLTWWEGRSPHGIGHGSCVVADQSYREIARFDAGHGLPADLHELLVTPQGTALVTANERRTMDLSSLGGTKRHPVLGGVVREIDVRSGRVVFDWRSLDHVALGESHARFPGAFDYFHVNSIDPAEGGDLIVSARNTWAIYRISRQTGRVIWRLGGKRSDFRMDKGTFFAWQHDARSHDGGRLLTLFDNGSQPKVEPQSRGLVIALDTKGMRATLVRAYAHRPPLVARVTGNTQVLENGNVLVGWGSEPWFTEYARDGSVVLDARFPRGGQTYRALRFPWIGRPAEAPRLVSRNGTLYVSWNGATEVASWQFRTGQREGDLSVEATYARTGFETVFPARTGARFAAAVALDARGRPLGTSATIAV